MPGLVLVFSASQGVVIDGDIPVPAVERFSLNEAEFSEASKNLPDIILADPDKFREVFIGSITAGIVFGETVDFSEEKLFKETKIG